MMLGGKSLPNTCVDVTNKKPPDDKIVAQAIASAYKHGISMSPGRKSAADGNCAFQSVLNNLNDRSCFPEQLNFSTDYYRRIWMTDMKNQSMNDTTWNLGYSREQLQLGWDEMTESGVYERGLFGDLMLP